MDLSVKFGELVASHNSYALTMSLELGAGTSNCTKAKKFSRNSLPSELSQINITQTAQFMTCSLIL